VPPRELLGHRPGFARAEQGILLGAQPDYGRIHLEWPFRFPVQRSQEIVAEVIVTKVQRLNRHVYQAWRCDLDSRPSVPRPLKALQRMDNDHCSLVNVEISILEVTI
jgi:hypothetical protein